MYLVVGNSDRIDTETIKLSRLLVGRWLYIVLYMLLFAGGLIREVMPTNMSVAIDDLLLSFTNYIYINCWKQSMTTYFKYHAEQSMANPHRPAAMAVCAVDSKCT